MKKKEYSDQASPKDSLELQSLFFTLSTMEPSENEVTAATNRVREKIFGESPFKSMNEHKRTIH